MEKIRFIFVYKAHKTRIKYADLYTIGLLTYDNRMIIENIMFRHDQKIKSLRNFFVNRLHKFRVIFENYDIDENTEVITVVGDDPYKDLMYELLKFYAIGKKFRVLNIKLKVVVNEIIKQHLKKKLKMVRGRNPSYVLTARRINTLYKIILERKYCPWIDNEFNLMIENCTVDYKSNQKKAAVGLYYMCIKNYKRNYDESKGNFYKYRLERLNKKEEKEEEVGETHDDK